MKTYNDVFDFQADIFPKWLDKDVKKKKTELEERIEEIDSIFLEKLEKAITIKKAEQKEETVKGKKAEQKGPKPPTADEA